MNLFTKIFLSLLFVSSVSIQAAFNLFTLFDDRLTISDISQTSATPIAALHKPRTVQELQKIVASSTKPIAIAGGRYSQGGQIAYPNGTVIDMTELKSIKNLDVSAKEITVEPGVTWRAIQHYINPHNLSVKVMQSYNDFTVGGSLSVNVHGRDIHHGPLIETVKSIQVLLANGTIVTASRTENPDLFAGTIGGYGALGIITQATISLTDNYPIEQVIKQMPIEEYPEFFLKTIKNNPKAVFHNANLYPTDFKLASSVTRYKTDKPLTTQETIQHPKKFYPIYAFLEQLLRRIPDLHEFRPHLDTKKGSKVVMRNHEMSSTVNTLEPLVRFPTTTVLQEYFIPLKQLLPFIDQVRYLAKLYEINIVNISIRYIPENNESILSYSKKECFSLVFYINIVNTKDGLADAKDWTQKLIDAALNLGGSYYLPYQLFGIQAQVEKSYPRLYDFLKLKKKYDPNGRFSNCLIQKYMNNQL